MCPTRKLYEEDSFLQQFTATVLACQPVQGGWAAVLDATAFYPEGGGQPADRGVLGGAQVLDVQEQGGVITHILSAAIQPGQPVQGQIDFARRLDLMQQHTGEHILSGTLHRLFGAENVGFHIGGDHVTMDTSVEIPPEGIAEAERQANAVIWADAPVLAQYPTPQALAGMAYRSKKAIDGPVRIVSIPGADVCACCGTHLKTAGQVGLIKVIEWQRYKGGTRLTVVCGCRALADFAQKQAELVDIRALLSAKPGRIAQAAHRLAGELEAQKQRAAALEQALFAQLAAGVQPGSSAVLYQPGLGQDSLRTLCLTLAPKAQTLCAVFSPGGQGLAYALAWPGRDVRPVCKALNEALGGRGGGKPELAMGSIAQTDFSNIQAFFAALLAHRP